MTKDSNVLTNHGWAARVDIVQRQQNDMDCLIAYAAFPLESITTNEQTTATMLATGTIKDTDHDAKHRRDEDQHLSMHLVFPAVSSSGLSPSLFITLFRAKR